MRKLSVFVAASMDGFIAGPNGDMSFLSKVHKEGEDYGYQHFIQTVDTVIMGRKTYDWVMQQVDEFPHKDKETYIITQNPRAQEEKVRFYNGYITNLVNDLKLKPGKNIFCDGGAEVINMLLAHNLIDDFIISVIPVLVGEGTRLFQNPQNKHQMILLNAHRYSTGLVQLHYQVNYG